MFEFGNSNVKILPVRHNNVALWSISQFEFPFVNGYLKGQRKCGLVFFDSQMGNDLAKESCGFLASNDPVELIPVPIVPTAVGIDMDRSSKLGSECKDNGFMRNADTKVEVVTPSTTSRLFVDSDATLSVKQSGDVSNIKHGNSSLSDRWDGGEFGGHPMPGPKGCGRTIPSQAGGVKPLGVCNEHVPPAKAKICSALHRKMETLAEMTSAVVKYIQRVTKGNTKYLRLQLMSGADFITTDFITPDNQAAKTAKILWMGNLICTARRRQGTLHTVTAPA